MKSKSFIFILVLSGIFFFDSCKDDPKIPNEEEVITEFKFLLTPQGGGSTIELKFDDDDGDGTGQITGGTLSPGTTYTGVMELENETADDDDEQDITAEIQEEAEEHQFFFSISGGLNLTVEYADVDANNNPLGLQTTVTTGSASSGNVTVILRHEPDKFATGVSGGDITNAGGETDIEVVFPITIQ